MICEACDGMDVGWMGWLGGVAHWYLCQSCGWWQIGDAPVCVDFEEAE